VCPVEQQALGMNSSNSSTGEQDLDSSSKGTGAQKSIVNRRSWERKRKKKKRRQPRPHFGEKSIL
jgi:hypothetical protein